MRQWSIPFASFLLSLSAVFAQAPFKSGPQPGTVLPGAFDALNINGKVAEGRQHCLICQNALSPTVLIFARDSDAKNDKPLTELLTKLDGAVEKHQESQLSAAVVFLSPAARSSVTEAATDDIDKLLDEATKRLQLLTRLKPRAEALKSVVVAAYPDEGPKGYNIDTKAAVTVVFYNRLKVVANWAYEEGKMTDGDVNAILEKVDEKLAEGQKKKKKV